MWAAILVGRRLRSSIFPAPGGNKFPGPPRHLAENHQHRRPRCQRPDRPLDTPRPPGPRPCWISPTALSWRQMGDRAPKPRRRHVPTRASTRPRGDVIAPGSPTLSRERWNQKPSGTSPTGAGPRPWARRPPAKDRAPRCCARWFRSALIGKPEDLARFMTAEPQGPNPGRGARARSPMAAAFIE